MFCLISPFDAFIFSAHFFSKALGLISCMRDAYTMTSKSKEHLVRFDIQCFFRINPIYARAILRWEMLDHDIQ